MINQCTDNNQANEIYWVADKIIANDFPDVTRALMEPDGLLAIGGDLDASRLLDAYQRGIFPWYNQGQPILWWSPDPRCILEPQQFHISHSLKKILRQEIFEVTCNQAFDQVIRHCAAPRKGTHGTWITEDIINAYTRLFELGHIMSIECWQHQQLVGGLYGVIVGKVYFGESMFSRVPNASKVAMAHLVERLNSQAFRLIDCQIYSTHLESLGARNISRSEFVSLLGHYCKLPGINNRPTQSSKL